MTLKNVSNKNYTSFLEKHNRRINKWNDTPKMTILRKLTLKYNAVTNTQLCVSKTEREMGKGVAEPGESPQRTKKRQDHFERNKEGADPTKHTLNKETAFTIMCY